jgi:hypothetical protein
VTQLNKAQLLQWVSGAAKNWTVFFWTEPLQISVLCITANLFSGFDR